MITALLLALAAAGCLHPPAKRVASGAAFTFPPEWAPQEAVWLGWSDLASHHPVQVQMIAALVASVRIRLLVTSDSARAEAQKALEAAGVPLDRVEFFTHPIFNNWIRDAGPRFLTDGHRLAIADFAWNWYGYPQEMTRDWPTRAGIDNDLARQLHALCSAMQLLPRG